MQDFVIQSTRQTPAIELAFSAHRLRIAGEAYPENAVAFFDPVLDQVRAYLSEPASQTIEAELELRYLNSASTKMVFKLVGLLDEAASKGRKVHLRFVVLEDDEMLQDLGADMRADFTWLDFEFVEMAA
jgi:hypothetical protein